jgi:hypothetical protein
MLYKYFIYFFDTNMVFDGLANMGYKFVGAFVFEQPSLCIKQL